MLGILFSREVDCVGGTELNSEGNLKEVEWSSRSIGWSWVETSMKRRWLEVSSGKTYSVHRSTYHLSTRTPDIACIMGIGLSIGSEDAWIKCPVQYYNCYPMSEVYLKTARKFSLPSPMLHARISMEYTPAAVNSLSLHEWDVGLR